jgi:PAS domain S-box-containing protein
MHPLLKRQLRLHFPSGAPKELEAFLDDVEREYTESDVERDLTERSLDLVSQEVLARDQQLRGTAERVTQLQRSLARTARTLSTDPGDLAASLRRVTEAACETLELDRCSVWAFNQERSELLCLDAYDPKAQSHEFGACRLLSKHPIYARAIELDRVIVAADAAVHAATKDFGTGATALLDAPVRQGERVVAVLCNEMRTVMRAWTPEELTFAASMADLISLLFESSARHRAEREVERQRAFLREIVDIDPNVIYAKDSSGAYTLVNRTAAELFGRPVDELLGHTDDTLRLSGRSALSLDQAVLESGNEVFIAEESLVDAAGRRKWFQTVKRPLLDADGRPRQVLSVSTDITERKRVEDERGRLESDLRQAQKMDSVGHLAGGIAHDFNNLLTPILVGSQMALEEVPQGSELSEALADVITAARRAKDLTAQLLAFGRKQVLELKAVDLNREVAQAQRMFRRLLPANIDLRVELSAAAQTVEADPVQLQQVLLNLVINARDAMPHGGVLTLSTHSAVPGPDGVPQAVVRATDNGTGIAPEVLPKIFEPFFTTKDRGRGTGLGLSTVYGIIKQHKGGIFVHSVLNQGTVFEVQLPLMAHAGAQAEPVEAARPALDKLTILLVEDEDLVLKFVRKSLERAGHHVLSARDAQEALEVGRKHPERIALVLSDVVLPGMNGLHLKRAFLEERPDTPFLFMSGHAQDALGAEAQRLASSLLHKPFTPKELLNRISEALRPAAA